MSAILTRFIALGISGKTMIVACVLLCLAFGFRLGGAYEYRAGYAEGLKSCGRAAQSQITDLTNQQLEERLNAEALARDTLSRGVCGPSIRDCPDP